MFRFSGLKLNIALTVVLLLVSSMVLGNFVTVTFWIKNMISSEINQAQSLTSIMGVFINDKLSGNSVISSKDLEKFFNDRDRRVTGVFFDGNSMVYPTGVLADQKMEQIVRKAGIFQDEIVKLDGNAWSLFSSQDARLFVAQPLFGKNLKKNAFCIQVSLQPIYQLIRQDLKTVFVYLAVNAIILFVVGWYRFANLVVRPIERMVVASESYNISDGFSFADDSSSSEFGQLSMALNSMLFKIALDREQLSKAVTSLEKVNRELIETQKDMILAEKLAGVGRLAAGLAHEVGNPLGIIQGYLELLEQSDINHEDKKIYAERAAKELGRINALIRQLLDFARTSRSKRESTSIVTMFSELKEALLFNKKEVIFKIISEVDNDKVICDQDGLRQVFLNCLLNALDAIEICDDGRIGSIAVKISEKPTPENGKIMVIEIEDNGIGVRPEKSFEYFEPFYTTKVPGKGTGLGLSVSHSIIEAHDGLINIEGKEGTGAVIIIELPFA